MKVPFIFLFHHTHRRQPARSTGGSVARKMTRPGSVPTQAATRREQPMHTHAKPKCELEPRYHTDDPDQIYTEMEDF